VHVDSGEQSEIIDEIEDYWNARYLSSGEASWRIIGFHLVRKDPPVTPLPVHLANDTRHQQYMRRKQNENNGSRLIHYFARPAGSFTSNYTGTRLFDDLTYSEYYSLFRLAKYNPDNSHKPMYFCESTNNNPMHVILRDNSRKVHLTRIHNIRPTQGDVFYLRAILKQKPARSFIEARTFNGVIHDTFQSAATEMGLFTTVKEAQYALAEAITSLYTPYQIRILFIHLLVNDCAPTPLDLWNMFSEELAKDFTLKHNNAIEVGIDHCLQHLALLLSEYDKHLTDFGLPEPTSYTHEIENEIERWSENHGVLRARALQAINKLNEEQLQIYHVIMTAITQQKQLLAFIDGRAGRGKTFLINAICDSIRAKGKIILPTATSAFAAQLYPGGRTLHSLLKVSNKIQLLHFWATYLHCIRFL